MRFRRSHRSAVDVDGNGDRFAPATLAGIGDEVESYLAGRLADELLAAGQKPPAWLAANALAHASYADLRQLVRRRGPMPRDVEQVMWKRKERVLVRDLLVLCRQPEDLRMLQLDLLVPLELALVLNDDARLTLDKVMDIVAMAIDDYLAGITEEEL